MTDPVTNSPQHKTVRDKLKEKLLELSEVSGRFGISHSMTIGHIIEDIERITGITDDSWMGIPWTEFLTCEQEAEVMEGRRAIKELAAIRSRPLPAAPDNIQQCLNCCFAGARKCVYHGYPSEIIPKYCMYKIGTSAFSTQENLQGTFIEWDLLKKHDAAVAAQARADGIEKGRKDVLAALQGWRYKAMNGTLKKDVWKKWNEETELIESLRQAGKGDNIS